MIRHLIVLTTAVGLLGTMATADVSAAQSAEVTEALRRRAVGIMRDGLHNEPKWVKVHAAEFLLALDYREDVGAVFQKELASFGDEPQYRIGIWRVLARETYVQEERSKWIERIRDAFLDPDGPDRLHAAEALGKLGHELEEPADDAADTTANRKKQAEFDAFELTAGGADALLRIHAEWVWTNSGFKAAEASLAEMLSSEDVDARDSAAYALRFRPEVSTDTLKALLNAVEHQESERPPVYLLSAAYHHAPEDTRPPLKKHILSYARDGSKDEKYEACVALGALGGPEDLMLLIGLMDDAGQHLDVRMAAANAVCRIERRTAHTLGGTDWLVIGLYGLGMIAVGWYYSRQTRSTEDYLLGGRQMKPLAVGLSMFATLLSTISYLSWPGEMIKYGPMILCGIAAYPLVILVVGWFMIPFIMKLKVTSAYEILESRFGLSIRTLGAIFFLSLRLLWMAVIIFATRDKVLIPLLGWDPSYTWVVCSILGLVTVVYTSMGGLRAVVFTDVVQTIILFLGAILTLILITSQFGGVEAWWPRQWPAHWPEFEWGLTAPGARMTVIGISIGTVAWWLCTSGSDQMAIQRYLATRDVKAARRVLVTSLAADGIVSVFLTLVGLALLAYFVSNPHLLPDGQTIMTDADKLFPRFIARRLPAGISGLVVAGMLAAAMSSLSSGVNSSCSVLTIDFIGRFRSTKLSEADHVRTAKRVSVAVGVVVVAMSLYVSQVEGNLLEIAYRVVNLLVGPLFVLFFMAMFVPWATSFGTWMAAVCSVSTAVLIAYWKNFTGMEGISFLWIMPGALGVGAVVGVLASLLPIGPKPKMMLLESQDEIIERMD